MAKEQDFKLCLTHYNYYGQDKNRGFAKYFYYGNFVFRGILAKRLFTKENRPITELEKAIEKIYSIKEMTNFFNYYDLEKYARYDKTLDLESLKRDFAISFLGFITMYASEEFLDEFIYKNFIRDTEHLYPKEKKEIEDIVHSYVASVLDKSFEIKTLKENETYITSVFIDGQLELQTESKGYKYSRKKAYKELIKHLCIPK